MAFWEPSHFSDPYASPFQLQVFGTNVSKQDPDYAAMRPYLGWAPIASVKKTLEHTTQFARAPTRLPMRAHYRSRFPAANVSRLNESFATDTFFSDVAAHDDGITGHGGCTMLQVYAGVKSHFLKTYPMSTESEMPGTLEDLIRFIGAPDTLISDNSKVQISKKVKRHLAHVSDL